MDVLADDDLACLTSLGQTLLKLNLGGCVRLGDGACAHLTALSLLRHLNLAVTAVTAPALARCLERLPHVVDLNLYGKRDLKPETVATLLAAAPSLKSLNARETGLTGTHVQAALAAINDPARDLVVLTGDRPRTSAPAIYCQALGDQRRDSHGSDGDGLDLAAGLALDVQPAARATGQPRRALGHLRYVTRRRHHPAAAPSAWYAPSRRPR